ncbi:MAG: DUF3821 domain-containing protein [Methanomicrobiales archaeon]|nr:DUF3821 domain-containing protein [Methanomicrobiales archaeon]
MNQSSYIAALLLLLLVISLPAAARGPTIKDIEEGDTVFLYEEDLDLSGITSDGQVSYLARIEDGEPKDPRLPVLDANAWSVPSYLEEDELGAYAVINGSGVWEGSLFIRAPELELEVTLAEPYHYENVEGLSLPEGTRIAFEITSVEVGNWYRVGSVTPAAVEIVVTLPGGAQTTSFGGQDLSSISISDPVVYTDDPGKPGSVVLDDLDPGTYKVQARWRTPEEFADYADDSNIIEFNVGDRTGIDTTPTTAPTTTPTPTTAPPTTPPPTTPTPVITTAPPTTPTPAITTAPPTTAPTPTPAPLSFPLVIIALCAAFVFAFLRR